MTDKYTRAVELMRQMLPPEKVASVLNPKFAMVHF